MDNQVQPLMRMITYPLLIFFSWPMTPYCQVPVVVHGKAARSAIQIAPRVHFIFLNPYEVLTWHRLSHGDDLSEDDELARIQLNRVTAGLGHIPKSMLRMASPGPLRIATTTYIEKYKPDLVVFVADSRDCIEDLYREMQATTPTGAPYEASMYTDCLEA